MKHFLLISEMCEFPRANQGWGQELMTLLKSFHQVSQNKCSTPEL